MKPHFLPVLWRSALVTLRNFWRLARQLFHEATGALFALFAIEGIWMVWRQWKNHPAWWLMTLAAAYSVMMGSFAFASFRRARRIR